MSNLLNNIDKIHTTELGKLRIAKNIGILPENAVDFCRNFIKSASFITEKGKNYYAEQNDIIITINKFNFVVITAHKKHRHF